MTANVVGGIIGTRRSNIGAVAERETWLLRAESGRDVTIKPVFPETILIRTIAARSRATTRKRMAKYLCDRRFATP